MATGESSTSDSSTSAVGDAPSFRQALKLPGVNILAASRAASRLAGAVVSYGAMVYLARQDASQFEISVIAAATYAAALAFGIQGGTLSDSLSKRIALIVGYLCQASLCLLVPFFWGTSVGALMFLMFMTSAINQLITPSLKSAVAIVSTPAQLATVTTVVTVIGSIASAVGSAVVAPVLIKHTGINTVLAVGAVIYLVGASRTLKLPQFEQSIGVRDAVRSVDWKPTALSFKWQANWIINHRSIATMILAGGIVTALFEAFNTLIPVYVRDVLNADPANAVYIFAPAGIGFLIGTLATPKLISLVGERRLNMIALSIMSVSLMLFGLIDIIAPFLAPFSPMRVFELIPGVSINDKVLAASLIALPANFGSTASTVSVQVFVNRRVPLAQQGSTFGLQEVNENALTLFAVVVLGGIATLIGPKVVFLIAPIVVVSMVILLLEHSYRTSGDTPVTYRQAFDMLSDSQDDQVQNEDGR